MKAERINQLIAEHCGWTCFGLWNGNPTQIAAYPPNGKVSCIIPDYCDDLNAMNEAESTLSEEELNHMVQLLYQIPDRFWRAKAPQRAEAFLKTIGKWEEE